MSDMWDSVAENWQRNADFVDRHMADATAALLSAVEVEPGDAVLELACGPGGAGLAAAAVVGESGRVVLADVAPSMVEVAAERAAALPQVSTAVFDLASIDAPDESFDVVISRHGLMFAESPIAAVREAARVLRPGGRYGAITWDSRAANPWLGLILDAVGEQFGVPFPPPSVPGPFSLDDRDQLRSLLAEGGLDDVSVRRSPRRCRPNLSRLGGSGCLNWPAHLPARSPGWSQTCGTRSVIEHCKSAQASPGRPSRESNWMARYS